MLVPFLMLLSSIASANPTPVPNLDDQRYYLAHDNSSLGCDVEVFPTIAPINNRLLVTIVPNYPIYFENRSDQWATSDDCGVRSKTTILENGNSTIFTQDFWRTCTAPTTSTAQRQVYVFDSVGKTIHWTVNDLDVDKDTGDWRTIPGQKTIECLWKQ